jgi:hypothetical protein
VINTSILQERLIGLLQLLAYEQRPCRACGQMLYFVQLPEGTTTPGAFRVKEQWVVAYSSEGENHADHCPGSAKKHAPEQQSLLAQISHKEVAKSRLIWHN